MGNMTGSRTLQDLVKSAMVESANRVHITEEARTQASKLGEKVAAAAPPATELAGQSVEKLASALDFLAEEFRKEGSLGGPYHLHEGHAAPPPGVSAASASKPLPDKKGEGVNIVPMHPGTQKGLPAEHGGTQMDNNLAHAPGGREKMIQKNSSVVDIIRQKLAATAKTAGDDAEKKETEGLEAAKKGVEKAEEAHKSEPENKNAAALGEYLLGKVKAAGEVKEGEDAINPAQISAGKAVPPETSAAGQSGGQPAGGAPQGPTGLVASNKAAIDYTKGQSHGIRREELGKYFKEPALSAQHDHVLQDAFEHTGKAGPKIASATETTAPTPPAPAPSAAPAPAHAHSASVKTAAARALLTNLAKTAEAEAKKNNPGTAAASA